MALFALYKPFGMLSQFTREHADHITLADIEPTIPKNVYPIGRLDADSEGLLLLSNKKKYTQEMMSPSKKVEKEYYVQVEGDPSEDDLEPIRKGMKLRINKKDFTTLPGKATIIADPNFPERNPPIRFRATIPTTWLSVVITEGKNRQVRKMCAKIGFPVLRLVRVRIGSYSLSAGDLKDMKPGEYIKV